MCRVEWSVRSSTSLCKQEHRRNADTMPFTPHLRLGRQSETLVCRMLRGKGYRILERNRRIGRRDEIDIIAHDPRDNVLVFVEVKARTSTGFHPELNLTSRKRRSIFRAARAWVAETDYDGGWRIDLVCVAAGKVIAQYEEIAEEVPWGN